MTKGSKAPIPETRKLIEDLKRIDQFVSYGWQSLMNHGNEASLAVNRNLMLSPYCNDEKTRTWLREIISQAAETAKQQGDAEGRRLMIERASQIESIRCDLVNAAGRVSIELGCLVRLIMDEAKKVKTDNEEKA